MVSWNEPDMWKRKHGDVLKFYGILNMWGHMHQKQIYTVLYTQIQKYRAVSICRSKTGKKHTHLSHLHCWETTSMAAGVNCVNDQCKAVTYIYLRSHENETMIPLIKLLTQPVPARVWFFPLPSLRGTPVTLHVLRPCASPRLPVSFRTLAAHAGPLSCGYRLIHWVTNHASPPESDNSGAAQTLRVRSDPLLWVLKGFALGVFQLL